MGSGEWGGRQGAAGGVVKKKILDAKLTFLSEVRHALLMPHMECFGSVSNKYFYQESSYSTALLIIPQGDSYKDIAVRG